VSVTIQLRGGTAAAWTTANPVLAQREMGIETDTQFYKIGDGVTAWNALPYGSLRTQDEATKLEFTTIATPVAPAAGKMNLYARPLAGRMLPRAQGPSGLATPLQPSFFQNQILLISPNTTTSVSTLGGTVASAGTLSHPAPSAAYGFMTNFVSGAVSGNTAGTGHAVTLWQRSTVENESNGFFFATRIALPDASYNESRIFLGLTNQTLANSVASDNPAGIFAGFFRAHTTAGLQQANWQFAVRPDGIAATVFTDTGLPFLAEKVYDAYIFCPPGGANIGWRIDNVTDGTTQEGTITSPLPGVNQYMRGGIQVATFQAQARNIRMQRIYCESDR